MEADHISQKSPNFKIKVTPRRLPLEIQVLKKEGLWITVNCLMRDPVCNLPQLKPVCTLFPPTAARFMGHETLS